MLSTLFCNFSFYKRNWPCLSYHMHFSVIGINKLFFVKGEMVNILRLVDHAIFLPTT